MKRLFSLLLVAFFLTGCAVYYVVMPTTVVLLTEMMPSMGTCSGTLVGPKLILTAAHCAEHVDRVVTPLAQETRILSYTLSSTADIAILHTNTPLWIADHDFATTVTPQIGDIGVLFANCPWYPEHVQRSLLYMGRTVAEIQENVFVQGDWWRVLPNRGSINRVCGGDSGAAILVDGKVAGVVSMVASELYFVALGVDVFAVPAYEVDKLLEVID
jgi:hypothetical protein